MAVQTPSPPRQLVDAVQARFRALGEQGFRSPALRAADKDQLQLTEPHQVFVLGADDLVGGRGLAAARPTRWRYLVQDGDKVIASASISSTAGTDIDESPHINEGPFVDATAAALKTVRANPHFTSRDFALRVLQVPALHTMAVWLHSPSGDDLLMPLAPSPVTAPAGEAIPADQLLTELAEKARQVMDVAADDTRGG